MIVKDGVHSRLPSHEGEAALLRAVCIQRRPCCNFFLSGMLTARYVAVRQGLQDSIVEAELDHICNRGDTASVCHQEAAT